MKELKNVLDMLKQISTSGEDTILMAQCLIALAQYINKPATEEDTNVDM